MHLRASTGGAQPRDDLQRALPGPLTQPRMWWAEQESCYDDCAARRRVARGRLHAMNLRSFRSGLVLLAAAALVLAASGAVFSQRGPIKIGLLVPLTGPLSANGKRWPTASRSTWRSRTISSPAAKPS